MVVSILGCGWYGTALGKSLIEKGIIVKGSTTRHEKLQLLTDNQIRPFMVDFTAAGTSFDPDFFTCDILIISIPPKFRKGETGDYLPKIKRIIETINCYHITKVIYISSTAVYAEENKIVTESDDPEPDTEQGRILLNAEQLFQGETAFETIVIRFAGLVGPGRHPGRFFAGKTGIPNGRSLINLIHLDDCIAITNAVIERNAFGYVFNAASPYHPSRADFYCKASLNAGLTTPQFIDELNNWKIVDSILLSEMLDYKFRKADWNDCDFD